MLCSFITDLIVAKFECGECLCKTKRMGDSMKLGMLHCFVGEHWQDVVLLVGRSGCGQG